MTPETYIATRAAGLSPDKQKALLRMRARHQQGRVVFSADEVARLQFVRWLHRSGRLTP
jgi:hypothetical protein